MTSLPSLFVAGEVRSVANPSELVDVSPTMIPVVVASRMISQRAISEATGTDRGERRAAINAVCDAFQDRHYELVRKAVS